MKRLALLFLCVSVISQAAVKVDARARCGEDITEQTFELDKVGSFFSIENECGTKTTVTLKQESSEGAEFSVQVHKEQTRDKEAVDSEARFMKTAYGDPVQFCYKNDVIDADLEMVVSPLESTEA